MVSQKGMKLAEEIKLRFNFLLHDKVRTQLGFAVGMFDSRGEKRGGPPDAVWFDGLASLGHAPSVVSAALDFVDHFLFFPADIAHPEVPRFLIETHPPGIAKSIGVDFGADFNNGWNLEGNFGLRYVETEIDAPA